MRVDGFLLAVFCTELVSLVFLFMPCGLNFKRSVILNIQLMYRLRFIVWTIWGCIGFIFISTLYDALERSKPSVETDKLLTTQAQRDAMLSFVSLLLFPIIRAHSNLLSECYLLQQSKEALTKQAQSASNYAKSLLNDSTIGATGKKTLSEDEKKSSAMTNTTTTTTSSATIVTGNWEKKSKEELIQELEGLQARLHLSNQARDEYKNKLKDAEKEITAIRQNDPTNTKKDK